MLEPLPAEVLARCTRLPIKPAEVVLEGASVELRPLDPDADAAPLYAVTCGEPCSVAERQIGAYDPDELIWKWLHDGPFADVRGMRDYLAERAAWPDALSLVVLDRATRIPIGVSAFMSNRPGDLKIELGSIWYAPVAQGTGASREATHLMLGHAFALGYRRVEWKCNALNERSRRAALSYGFTFEGVQQAHMIVKGRNRDTAWYRMLDHEWPVRSRTM
jgi:RimJ/RimL family protein N-acetyltransferase